MEQNTEIKSAVETNTEPNPPTTASTEPTVEPAIEQKTESPAAPVPKIHRSYTQHDIIFAWLAYISGYLFCRAFPFFEYTLGGMLFIILIFALTAAVMIAKKIKFSAPPIIAAVSAIVLSASLLLSSNTFIHFFTCAYTFAAYCYFVYSATGNSLGKSFSSLLIIDSLKAIFSMPLGSFKNFELFRAIFNSRTKKSAKFILRLLIGVVVAIIPAGIVLSLLSYDKSFSDLVAKIFDFEYSNIVSHVLSLIFAIPIGMYIFSLYISCVDKKPSKRLNAENYIKLTNKIKIAPVVTVLTAVIPLLAIYVIFFISQWQYYISGFTGVLPEKFSYAEYAREGFFQLCAVSVINLTVIVAVMLLIKNSKASSVITKILTVIFSVFTLVLISTAVAKMVMYIQYYGLTQKRVYATWFMAVLAVIFITITLSRFIKRISWIPVCACVLIVSFTGLALSNADSLIAKYNVDRYLDGTLDTVDVEALVNLDDAAIPEMVRLVKYLDEKNGTDIKKFKYTSFGLREDMYGRLAENILFKADQAKNEEENIFSYSLNEARAKKALKDLGLTE